MSHSFLVVRLSAIGDTIHTLPLAAALRRHFPDSRIGWVVEKPASPLIVGNPLLDWSLVMPRKWMKSPAEIWRMRQAFKAEKFEVAIDVQGLAKSGVAAWLSGARLRLGFAGGEAREGSRLFCNRRVPPAGGHIVDKTLSLLSGLGVARPAAEFVFPECPADDAGVIEDFLADPVFANGFALFGPGGSFPGKLWPLPRYLELAMRLKESFGLASIVLSHGREEQAALKDLLSGRDDGAMFPAPGISVLGVVELARRARIFVGGDSFPMHAAAAVATPTAGLFAVTDSRRLGPYGPGHAVVQNQVKLFNSRRARAAAGNDLISSITVDMAFAACLGLLSRPRRENAIMPAIPSTG